MQSLLDKLKQIKWTDRRFILVVVIVILVFLMMDFNNRMVRMLELEQQESQLSTKVAALEQTKVKVEAEIAYATSDRALEEWAREKDRLINEGDYPIIIIPPTDQVITPTPVSTQEAPQLSRFQIWKELFFGEQ
ncbi:MAG: septum formation initiator family protein [Anaerolineaceae bacterium]|jgi:cell division protein FtsB